MVTQLDAALSDADDELSDDDLQDSATDANQDGDPDSGSDGEGEGEDTRERSIDEIRAALRDPKGHVSGAEFERLRRHDQSVQDQLRQQEKDEAALSSLFDGHTDGVLEDLTDILNDNEIELKTSDQKRLKQLVEGRTSKIREQATKAALVGFNQAALSDLLQVYGDSPENRARFVRMPIEERLQSLYDGVLELGRRQGPGEDYVVMTKAEYEAELEAAGRGARPSLKAPPRGERRPAAAGRLTREQFLAMSLEDQAKAERERPDEVAALA